MSIEVKDSFYDLVENVCRELYIRSLKEIPPDVVEAIRKAAATETKEVAKRIFSHYLESIDLGRNKDMIVCQDTGIPIYWVDIGGKLLVGFKPDVYGKEVAPKSRARKT